MNRLSFSVVVNTYNRADLLPNAIASLLRLRHPQYEIIVVNGPSTDNTEAVLAEFSQHIKIGECPVANLGKSRNIGIALAAGDIVAFIDDDSTAEPNWLDEFEPAYDDPNVGAVGGFTRDNTGYGFQWRYTVCDWIGDGRSYDSPDQANLTGHLTPNGFLYPSGTNSSFRRSMLLEIGGFDEFYAYLCDESDLVARLIERGYTVRCAPAAQVHHRFAASHVRTHAHVPKSFIAAARSRGYFAAQHGMAHLPASEVTVSSAKWLSGHLEYVSNLAAHGDISADDASRLSRELNDGLRDGFSNWFQNPRPRVRSRAELDRGGQLKMVKKGRSEPMLRVCFISDAWPWRTTDSLVAYAAASALAKAGHEVSIIAPSDTHTRVDFEDGVWVHRIQHRNFLGRRTPSMPDLDPELRCRALAVRDEVLRIRAVRGLHAVCVPLANVTGMALMAGGELPVVVNVQMPSTAVLDNRVADKDGDKDSRIQEQTRQLIAAEHWCLQRADLVLTPSHRLLAAIEKFCEGSLDRKKVSIVPRGVPGALNVDPVSCESEAGEVVLLCAVCSEPGGELDVLLEAVPVLLQRHAALRVVLIEREQAVGVAKEQLEAFKARQAAASWLDRVEFLDSSLAYSGGLHKAVDIVAVPDKHDFTGIAHVEGLKLGKPVVAPRAGAALEVVEDGITGLLVAPGEPNQWVEAITELIENPTERRIMGAAARASFLTKFDPEQLATRYKDAFVPVIEGHRRGRTAGEGGIQMTATESRMQLDPHRLVGPESRKSYRQKLAAGFFTRYLSGANILEIGHLGDSPDSLAIVPQAIGIDLGYPGYDGINLPFPSDSQDAVYSSHCLEHIDDSVVAMREWFRVIRTGGFLVVAVPHQYLYERRREMPSKWAPGWHKRYYTPASLLAEVEAALIPNSYRIRHLVDNDQDFDYSRSPTEYPIGCYEIELVLEKIKLPSWALE